MFLALGTDALEMSLARAKHGVPMGQVFTLDEKSATAAPPRRSWTTSAAARPMNCPSHCLMFAADRKQLPRPAAAHGRLRPAAPLRALGVTHGLSRVRTFCQDDAHIFCTPKSRCPRDRRFFDLLDEVYAPSA
jgi:threonyl-tRNA synthetase